MVDNRKKIALLACYPVNVIRNHASIEDLDYVAPWLVALSKALECRKDEFQISWIIASKEVSRIEKIHKFNQDFYVFPRLKKTIGLLTGYIFERYQIHRILNMIKPDLVHSWGIEDCYAVSGGNFKGPKLLSIQGLLASYQQRGEISFFESKQILWEKSAFKKFFNFTTESPWSKEELLKWKKNADVSVIDYPVEPFFHNIKRSLYAKPTFLFIGTLRKIKGVELLIHVFSQPELQHVDLLIAGSGKSSFIEKLKNSASQNIKFLGRQTRVKVVDLLAKTWCLIHPSFADTGPTVVKEARVMGVPVILTENCGSKQYVINGKSGYIFDAGNSTQLTDAALKLSESQNTAIEMGNFDRERCINELSGENSADKFIDLYNNLLGNQ